MNPLTVYTVTSYSVLSLSLRATEASLNQARNAN